MEALRSEDMAALAGLDACASLRDDCEVSVPEVETAVEHVEEAGATGARIMGGGFGGAVGTISSRHRSRRMTSPPGRTRGGARLLG